MSELKEQGTGAGEAGYPRAADRGGTHESAQCWCPALWGQKPRFTALSLPKESMSPPWRISSYPRELGEGRAGKRREETAPPGHAPLPGRSEFSRRLALLQGPGLELLSWGNVTVIALGGWKTGELLRPSNKLRLPRLCLWPSPQRPHASPHCKSSFSTVPGPPLRAGTSSSRQFDHEDNPSRVLQWEDTQRQPNVEGRQFHEVRGARRAWLRCA